MELWTLARHELRTVYERDGSGKIWNILCHFGGGTRERRGAGSADRIESGRLRSDVRWWTNRMISAMATPRPALSATKYHKVGNPRMKITAVPMAKRRPMNPPPTGSLCMLMPG